MKHLFHNEGIIDEFNDDALDLWSCYIINKDKDIYDSLHNLMYTISFSPKPSVKMYNIKHEQLYDMLS